MLGMRTLVLGAGAVDPGVGAGSVGGNCGGGEGEAETSAVDECTPLAMDTPLRLLSAAKDGALDMDGLNAFAPASCTLIVAAAARVR